MFNVRIFKLRDLLKYLFFLLIVVIIIFIIKNTIIKNLEDDKEEKSSLLSKINLTHCFGETSTVMKQINDENKEKKDYNVNLYENIIKSQIGSIEAVETAEEVGEIEEMEEQSVDVSNEIEQERKEEKTYEIEKVNTEVITNNPIQLKYNNQYGNVKIKNETSHELTEEMLNPDINIDNKNILLFHTHTCESYTSSEQFQYEATGNYRTTDLNYTVARLGRELKTHLETFGYNVIHDTTYHDYPSYNGSYTRSLETVNNILKSNPADIIFDIHRDAIGSRSDYAPCVKIGDDVCAQIMFVVGSDEGGLWHPNWNQNLKFAIKVQQKAEELYPGLFKPITLTKYRYNQHSGKYASIIEVGATGNTLEQCINSMEYLGNVLNEVLKNSNNA